MNTVHSIAASGLILLVTCLANHATAQTGPAGKQLSADLTAALLGDSRPRPQRIVPPVRQQPFAPVTSQVRGSNSQNVQNVQNGRQKKAPPEKQPRRIVGVTTLAQPAQPKLTTGQQAPFRPFQLGNGQPASRVGVSRFANSGMRPSESGGLPVAPRVVPEFTQDQRAALLERSIRERVGSDASSLNSYSGELAADHLSEQAGGDAGQGSGDSSTEQNPAAVGPAVSTALPSNFVANRLARPSTGVSRFSGPPSVRGPASPRRASGIPSSPMILPAGAGRRSSAGLRGGGCGGG